MRLIATDVGTVRQKKNEPIFFCVHLFLILEETCDFFHEHQGKYQLQFSVFNVGMR